MRLSFLYSVTALITLSACTIGKDENGSMAADFHPPLVESEWKTHNSQTENGDKVCVVTNGHNGLLTSIYYAKDGTRVTNVEHTRRLSPGIETTLSVGGNVYRTRTRAFASSQIDDIIASLASDPNGKAYLEWSEVYTGVTRRLRSSTIIPLNNFKSMFDRCVAVTKK